MGDSKKSLEKASKTSNQMEWPAFLDPIIHDVIKNDFKFQSMTPVQVILFTNLLIF
jgi:hypothetical protein